MNLPFLGFFDQEPHVNQHRFGGRCGSFAVDLCPEIFWFDIEFG